MANATNLNNVSSFLAYNVADDLIKQNGAKKLLGNNDLNYIKDSGASWLNTMAFLEKGDLNSNFLSGLYKEINKTYGDDTASKVLTYKELFGLNYEGSIQMFNLQERLANASDAEKANITDEIRTLQGNPEFKNAETRLADSMSLIDKSIHDLAKGSFEIKSTSLDAISTSVDLIYRAIVEPDQIVKEPADSIQVKKAQKVITGQLDTGYSTPLVKGASFNEIMSYAAEKDKEKHEELKKYWESIEVDENFATVYNNYQNTYKNKNGKTERIDDPDELLQFFKDVFDKLTKAIEDNTTELSKETSVSIL